MNEQAMLTANGLGLRFGPVTGFRALAGRGVSGQVAGQALVLGNARLMAEAGVDTAPLLPEAAR